MALVALRLATSCGIRPLNAHGKLSPHAMRSAPVALLGHAPDPCPPRLSPSATRRLEKVNTLLARHPGVLLVDGNNARAATGFRYTVSEMSACLDSWAARSGFSGRIAVCWDHGEVSSFTLSHSIALLSGSDQSADDVIVQVCGFLGGGCDVIVFSSDKALLGRCHTQWREADGAASKLHSLHAVYLTWLFETDEEHGWRGSAACRERYAIPHQCRSESTAHRAVQANALLQELRGASTNVPTSSGQGDHQTPAAAAVHAIAAWFGGGCGGLGVARESRSGNPIYALERTLLLGDIGAA